MAAGTITIKELESAQTLKKRLSDALVFRGTNPNAVEGATGIKRQTLYAVLRGGTAEMKWSTLEKLAAHLGVRVRWLAMGELPVFPSPTLEEWEVQLIHDLREMSEDHRRSLLGLAKQWSAEDSVKPSKNRPFRKTP